MAQDIPLEVSKAWADELERWYTRGNRWEEGAFRVDDSLIYLVVDGAYTTSLYRSHWSRRLARLLKENSCQGTVCAFSYAGFGLHYLPERTVWRLQQALIQWAQYISRLERGQRLIPICFSLGAAVTLLGLQDWFAATRTAAGESFPAAILVAPAHAPSPALLQGYQQKVRAGELQEIPWPVRQLCRPGSEFREKAIQSFRTISESTIRLHVIYWPQDRLTPFRPEDFPSVDARQVLVDKPLDELSDAVTEHLSIRDNQETETALISILNIYNQPA